MELNTLSKITCYSRKLSLKNFINKNNKVTLIFSKKDYNDYDFIEVIIKNTKNKEEFFEEVMNKAYQKNNNLLIGFTGENQKKYKEYFKK